MMLVSTPFKTFLQLIFRIPPSGPVSQHGSNKQISNESRTPNSVTGRRRSTQLWQAATKAAVATGKIFSHPLNIIMVAYRIPIPPENTTERPEKNMANTSMITGMKRWPPSSSVSFK